MGDAADDLGPCYCGNPLCTNLRHLGRMARQQSIAKGNGDPLVAVGHLLAIAATVIVLVKWPPPLWIFLPFTLAFSIRFELLWRQARRRG